jgi:hypothetical protein
LKYFMAVWVSKNMGNLLIICATNRFKESVLPKDSLLVSVISILNNDKLNVNKNVSTSDVVHFSLFRFLFLRYTAIITKLITLEILHFVVRSWYILTGHVRKPAGRLLSSVSLSFTSKNSRTTRRIFMKYDI